MVYELKEEISEEALKKLNIGEIDPGHRVYLAINKTRFIPSLVQIDDFVKAVESGEEIVNPTSVKRGDVVFGRLGDDEDSYQVLTVTDESECGFDIGTVHLETAKQLIRKSNYRVIGQIKLPRIY
jgi:hypothetical protein